jgi:hypothetical protein
MLNLTGILTMTLRYGGKRPLFNNSGHRFIRDFAVSSHADPVLLKYGGHRTTAPFLTNAALTGRRNMANGDVVPFWALWCGTAVQA